MADVTEVVHKITYETETSSIEKANTIIQQQLKELKLLNDAANTLSKTMQSAGDKESQGFKKVSQELSTVNKQLQKMAAKTKGALSEVGKGVQAGLSLGTGMAGVAEKATELLVNMVNESIALAQEVDAIKGSFDALNNPELLSGLRVATQGTVSDLELMKQAVAYHNIGVPIAQMSNLLIFAQARAQATGKSVDELVKGIVTGIGNNSAVALGKLGVDTYKLNEAFKETNDFATAAFTAIQQQSDEAGERILTVTEKQAQVNAALKNQQAEMGKTFNELGGYVKAFLADFVSEGDFALTQSYHNHIKAAEKLAEDQQKVQKKANDLFTNNFQAYVDEYTNSDYKGRLEVQKNASDMYDKLAEEANQHYAAGSQELTIYLSGLKQAYNRAANDFARTPINLNTVTTDTVKGLNIDELNELQKEIGKQDNKRNRNSAENDRYNKILEAIQREKDLIFGKKKSGGNSGHATKQDPLQNALATDDQLKRISEKSKQLNEDFAQLYKDDNLSSIKRSQEELAIREAQYRQQQQKIDKQRQLRLVELELMYEKDTSKILALQAQKAKLEKEQQQLLQNDVIEKLPLRGTSSDIATNPPELQPIAVPKQDNDEDDADKQEARRERIKKTIKEYQNLAQAAVDAYNTIAEVQIKTLDEEIKVREKRVEAAKKLAERGNAEALRLEEERLVAAQRKRDQIAKRQATVNAALALSNSLVAVTGAISNAVKGDPYSIAVRVAAAIAAVIGALGSGYAFVKSFDAEGVGAFADGVVAFRGKGGPRDDSNLVRISNGESVITAEGTKKNRALLEAINNGNALQLIDPSMPFLLPSLKSPSSIGGANTYARTEDLKGLERKFDQVVGAIENNKLRQNIFFNEQGVGIMTERAVHKNRKRWM